MQTDLYSKIILTIIAFCLVIIVIRDIEFIPKANANSIESLPDTRYGLVPINDDGSINVRINQGSLVDVRLIGIDEALDLSWDPISVNVVKQ